MREMKDSGIEWVGQIPETWETIKIDSLYSVRNTKVSDFDYPPLSVTMQGIMPQLDTAAKTNDHNNRKLVKKGDFAINSRSDRRGSCGISDLDGSVSLINTVLKPNRIMNSQYYNWLFHTSLFADEFYKWGHGIVDDLWTTNWQDMKKISVPYPDIRIQELIADFLDAKCSEIDALTADIEKQIETLEAYKKSVITEAVTKGLNPDVEMKDSGIEWIGQIPENWKIVRIKYLMYERKEKTIGGCEEDALSVTQNRGIIKSIDANVANPSSKFDDYVVVKKGDLVFNKYKAHSGVFFVTPYDGIVTFNYSVYRCFKDVESRYYQYLFKTDGCIGEFRKRLHGVGESISPLYTKDLFDIVVIKPSKEEQNKISDYLDDKCTEMNSIINAKKKQLDVLADYKKSLIYEYVTGKKEVPNE